MLFGLLFGGRPKPLDRATAREALATLHEVVLMPYDLATAKPPKAAAAGGPKDLVVFLHGFCASPGVFRPFRERLARDGIASASFIHLPGTSVTGIAKKLADLVATIPEDIRVHIVGHSLGGLAARWYVQELGGEHRVSRTMSLGSPFGGTEVARRFPIFVGKDLQRDGAFLTQLRARAQAVSTPHVSFVGSRDSVVIPIEGALLAGYPLVVRPNVGHNAMLYDPPTMDAVVELVRECAATAHRPKAVESGPSAATPPPVTTPPSTAEVVVDTSRAAAE